MDLKLEQLTVYLKDYNESQVVTLEACSVYHNHGNQTYKASCKLPDSKGQ